MPTNQPPNFRDVAKRQAVAIGLFLLFFALIVVVLYWKDRQREWRLREEQASHRLELAYELITRDLERVRSDILYVANQQGVRNFDAGDDLSRTQVEYEFANFIRIKKTCQQIRLVDIAGKESVRVELRGKDVEIVPETELQDKKDRYYVRESLRLRPGELFVSEFDLNQEHGVIEQPLNPVIRFVTRVKGEQGDARYLLVANYRGAALLEDLAAISLPGKTFLIREDGCFLLGSNPNDAWGWLLDHPGSFNRQFSDGWNNRTRAENGCILTRQGAFAFRQIQLQRFGRVEDNSRPSRNKLLIVSYLSSDEVFETSNQLLSRLLILVFVILLPLLALTRFWAVASSRRKQQNMLILASETKLRELSSRLVRIQEEERRAISREIHDQLGQQVTAINLDLKLAQREAESSKAKIQLQRAIEESEQLLNTLHDFATRVRPVELDDLGLHDAVESHLWELKNRTGIDFDFDSNLDQLSLPDVISENVYRLIQESLNNVVKHADATRVAVSIMLETSNNQTALNICVQDDGVGASKAIENMQADDKNTDGKSRLGILGMRERVDLLGGSLDLTSAIGNGTTIKAWVPINEAIDALGRKG